MKELEGLRNELDEKTKLKSNAEKNVKKLNTDLEELNQKLSQSNQSVKSLEKRSSRLLIGK